MKAPIILDLCAGTGAWSEPYVRAEYDVRRFDVEDGVLGDVRLLTHQKLPIHGILCAPPCTVFSYARNRYEPTPAEFSAALAVVDACLRAVVIYRPHWWVLENPINKLRRFLGDPMWIFRQWEYGDTAIKPTALWGDFTPPMKRAVLPSKPSTYGTNRENARPVDAVTPPEFARYFFEANP